MKTCIICRLKKDDNQFNDEHVIPESIGGYYHIYTVCFNCNSKLGSNIDNKLTNHKFIEFQRHLLGIKGKSGSIPNPFSGTHVLQDDPNQKVQLVLDEDGKFKPRLLPNVPREIPRNGESIRIVIDQKDEKQIDSIIDKFLSRNGLTREHIKFERKPGSSHPWIEASMHIDIHKFKLAILKIAYEFTVDKIPEYFNDKVAIKISSILINADFDALDKVNMIGNGLESQILQPFEHLLDFKQQNHYLILFDSFEYGLLCFVNLFNTFTLGFIMSEKPGYIDEFMLILKNDIEKREAQCFTLPQIVGNIYTPMEYKFQYFIRDFTSVQEFAANDSHPNFAFYRENDQIPFFDRDGVVKYTNVDLKLKQEQLQKIDHGDITSEIRTEIRLDEELYIRLLPIDKLYQVSAVQLIQYRKGKV